MPDQTEREAWRHVAKGAIEVLQQLPSDVDAGGAIAVAGEAIASALMALGVQEELLTVEQLGATDLPRDAAHKALDDPRYADRCGHHWIIVEEEAGRRRLQLHECFQGKGHAVTAYPSGTDRTVHQCVCGLTRSPDS